MNLILRPSRPPDLIIDHMQFWFNEMIRIDIDIFHGNKTGSWHINLNDWTYYHDGWISYSDWWMKKYGAKVKQSYAEWLTKQLEQEMLR